jgi:hypothetical protein
MTAEDSLHSVPDKCPHFLCEWLGSDLLIGHFISFRWSDEWIKVAHEEAESYGHFVGEYLYLVMTFYRPRVTWKFGNLTDYKWVISYNYWKHNVKIVSLWILLYNMELEPMSAFELWEIP